MQGVQVVQKATVVRKRVGFRPGSWASVGCRALVLLCSFVLAFAVRDAGAADAQISVRAEVEPSTLALTEEGLLRLEIDIPEGWHLWSLDPGDGPRALSLRWREDSGLGWAGPFHGDLPQRAMDRGFGRELSSYEQPTVHLERQVRLHSALPSELQVQGEICNPKQCIPQKLSVPVAVTVAEQSTGAVAPASRLPELSQRSSRDPASAEPSSAASAVGAGPAASAVGGGLAADLAGAQSEGVLAFLLMAFVFGLGALATPCVFPAIPLTVSFFSKYSEESFGRGARLAFVYAGTMVAAFTVMGVVLSVLFGVTGVQQFAAHPVFNLLLAVVLVFFALNLLGLFELSPPQALVDAVNQLEGKYGAAAGQGKRGARDYLVVAIAAVSATTVFFTCTVGFVGLVLVAAANGEWFWPTLGMLAFASAFALPFFLLALFPQAARRLQGKAGSWLSATRVTLGFLELAAATKFFSNADLVWGTELLSRNTVLALWVPLFFLCGMFLMGKLQIGEETTQRPGGGTGVAQMLASVVMFSLSIHLGVGLLHNRPLGGWIDGWLPPLSGPAHASLGAGAAPAEAGLAWVHSLEEGRERARAEGKLVFVNYTGYTCTNCRYMEGGVFPDPRIRPLLEQMVLVELFTDGGKPEHDQARADQVERFGTAALPLYSVETPEGQVLGSFPSSTNDIGEFQQFLQEAMRKGEATLSAPAATPGVSSAPKGSAAPAATPEGSAAPQGSGTRGASAASQEAGSSAGSNAQAGLVLAASGLFEGRSEPALASGKWTLLNFWATWCSPCRQELEDFLAEAGARFEKDGGAFRLLAVEEEDNLPSARQYITKLGVDPRLALRLPADPGPESVDERFGFEGTLPFTALVSPTGQIAWRHEDALTREQLEGALTRHVPSNSPLP